MELPFIPSYDAAWATESQRSCQIVDLRCSLPRWLLSSSQEPQQILCPSRLSLWPRAVVHNLEESRCSWTATPRNPSQHSWKRRLLGIAVQEHLSCPWLGTTGLKHTKYHNKYHLGVFWCITISIATGKVFPYSLAVVFLPCQSGIVESETFAHV